MKIYHLSKYLISSRPSQAALFLTYRCNSRCSWCNSWQKPPQKELSLSQYQRIFGQLKHLGINLLYLSGGEPLLRLNSLEIIRLAQSFGFDLILTTNGILLNEKMIHQLVKIPSLKVNVSLDSLNEDLYRKIRGVNALNQVLKNLKLFRKLYPDYPLRITMTVSAANLAEAEKVYRFCQKYRFYFSPNPYFEKGRFRRSAPFHNSPGLTKRLIRYYQNISQKAKNEIYLSGFPLIYQKLILWLKGTLKEPCGAGEELLYIDPKGLVYACQDLKPFANLLKEDLSKAWQKKTWLPAVQKCSQNSPCFIYCTRAPYLIKHHKIRMAFDLLTSKKLFHYFKMY